MTSTSNDQEAVKVLHTNNNNSIALQRFNTILLHESFGSDIDRDL